MDDQAAQTCEYRDPLVGRLLHDRYRVLWELGRGGMGVVYLAEHVLLQRKVAIKTLHPQSLGSEELVLRFHREARAAAGVGNEHIVDVTDMGRLDDGSYYLALEYLDGADLATVVNNERALSVARSLSIATQICDALAAVHAAGIVHRDLKPENVFLISRPSAPDFVKILDFGICKFVNDRPLTATGVALGTPRFMSPEQLEARRDVDHRADLYAVGAILFYALAGQGPFDGVSLPQLVVSIWRDPPPSLRAMCPEVPEELERVVMRALHKDPARRFQSAVEFKEALAPFLASTPPSIRTAPAATTPSASPTRREWGRKSKIRETFSRALTIPGRRRARPTMAAAGALLGCAALLSFWFAATTPNDATTVRHAARVPPTAATSTDAHEDAPAAEVASESERVAAPPDVASDAIPDVVTPRRRSPARASTATRPEAHPEVPAQPAPPIAAEEPPPATAPPAQPVPVGPVVPLPAELKRVF